MNKIYSINNIYKSYKKCLLGVSWKGTVQYYKCHSLTSMYNTFKDLQNNQFKSGKFYEFTIIERGKKREIKSVGIKERVVQKVLCDNVLVPQLSKSFIYDNCACIKGKGVHFALKRMKKHLHDYYIKYNTNIGWILQFDFSKYFDNISHEKLIKFVENKIKDKETLKLYKQLVNDFQGDYGLGLGSQISQISALFYPNKIDHFFSRNSKIFRYGRYMDDGYIIATNKEELHKCLYYLKNLCKELEIKLNEKKTKIVKLTHGFEYLKARFYLLNNGKIVVKPNKKNISKNRKKLKKLRKLLDENKINFEQVKSFFNSIIGNLKHYNSYYTIKNFKKLYYELFKEEIDNDRKAISLY